MVLAAMAMLQNPVVPVGQETMAPEVQAEAAADEVAILAAETLAAPETRSFAPQPEQQTFETAVEDGESQTVDQALAEELPQTVQAPEAAQETEGRTVEIKVERGESGSKDAEAAQADETAQPQGGEAGTPVFEEVKAVPVKVGEAPKAAETEAPVEKQIAPKLKEALQNGETRVELQLTPENLGKVTVEMTWSKDGTLAVQMHAENRGTQDLLAKSTNELAQLLGREAQQEVRVEVPRQEESQRQDLYEQQQEQQRQRQQEQRRRRETGGEDFLQQLRLGRIGLVQFLGHVPIGQRRLIGPRPGGEGRLHGHQPPGLVKDHVLVPGEGEGVHGPVGGVYAHLVTVLREGKSVYRPGEAEAVIRSLVLPPGNRDGVSRVLIEAQGPVWAEGF